MCEIRQTILSEQNVRITTTIRNIGISILEKSLFIEIVQQWTHLLDWHGLCWQLSHDGRRSRLQLLGVIGGELVGGESGGEGRKVHLLRGHWSPSQAAVLLHDTH